MNKDLNHRGLSASLKEKAELTALVYGKDVEQEAELKGSLMKKIIRLAT